MAKRPSKIGSLTSPENRVVMSHYTVVSLNDHDLGLDVAVNWQKLAHLRTWKLKTGGYSKSLQAWLSPSYVSNITTNGEILI